MTPENGRTNVVIVTGFGDKGIEYLAKSIQETFAPKTCKVIQGAPLTRALWHPDRIIENTIREIRAIGENIILFGHSYGAFIAMAAAVREKLNNILTFVAIDGPLNADVPVQPALPSHWAFFRQYMHRPRIAKEYEMIGEMAISQQKPIITIASPNDRIIPGKAKSVQGATSVPLIFYNNSQTIAFDARPGVTHITLPEKYGGHSMRPQKSRLVAQIASHAYLESQGWAVVA